MRHVFALATAILSLATAGFAGGRHALVIGNDSYDHLPADLQLAVAVRDAKLIEETLTSVTPPFEVTRVENVTREGISLALDKFADTAKGADCALIYFAGHGIEYHGENYLVMSDSRVESDGADIARTKERLYFSMLSMQKALDDLQRTGAELRLFILDACRENPFAMPGPGKTRTIVGSKIGLTRVTAPSGMLISYSADAGQQANDGLFTPILAKYLAEPGLDLMYVFAKTRADVRTISTELRNEERGSFHEPAEYNKLDPGALSFQFNSSDAEPAVTMQDIAASFGGVPWSEILESSKAETPPPAEPSAQETLMSEAFSLFVDTPPSVDSLGYKKGDVEDLGGIEMIYCPDQRFIGFFMGSSKEELGRDGLDEDVHPVELSGFFLAKHELTQKQWTEVMASNPSLHRGDDLPIHGITYQEAQLWCEKKNVTIPAESRWRWVIPSEAQWEYACRAGTITPFSFGETLDSTEAVFDWSLPYGTAEAIDAEYKPRPVASFPGNPWGFHDMHGNVAEWCFDIYDPSFYSTPTATHNPTGPARETLRSGQRALHSVRGGDYMSAATSLRSAARSSQFSDVRSSVIGFRPAMIYLPESAP